MGTVAPWAEAQLHDPSQWPLASPHRWGTASARPGCAPRAWRVVTAQGTASAHGVVSSLVLHQRPNNDKVHSMPTTMAQATCHYTDTSTEKAGKGSSLKQRWFGGYVRRRSGQK
jgi:hypothetical protein